MNLVEVWIKDIVRTKEIEVDGVKKLEISFNTDCWGCKEVKTRVFDNMEEWEKFKSRRFYLA